MSTTDKITEMERVIAKTAVDEARQNAASTESPMETLFLLGLLASGLFMPSITSMLYDEFKTPDWCKRIGGIVAYSDVSGIPAIVVSQLNIKTRDKTFRVDFGVWFTCALVAIEIDGHEFHEKTKRQAAADKSRDRALTAAGWKVIRFAGSEVYADPIGCAEQLHELLMAEEERYAQLRIA